MRSTIPTAIGIVLFGRFVFGGGTPEHLCSDEELLRDWRRDVYVVKVKSVDDKEATNNRPPRVVLVIKEALRGQIKLGAEVEAIWHPFPHDIDTTGREKELEAWNRRPLRGPKVGEELIILEYAPLGDKPFLVSPRCRFPYSKQKRDWVASFMGDWKQLRRQAAEKKAAGK